MSDLKKTLNQAGIVVYKQGVRSSDVMAAVNVLAGSSGTIETYGEFWRDGKEIWMHTSMHEFNVTSLFPDADQVDFIPEGEMESIEMVIEIEYKFTKGSRQTQTDPSSPPEIEYQDATLDLPNDKKMKFGKLLDLKGIDGLFYHWDESVLEIQQDDEGPEYERD